LPSQCLGIKLSNSILGNRSHTSSSTSQLPDQTTWALCQCRASKPSPPVGYFSEKSHLDSPTNFLTLEWSRRLHPAMQKTRLPLLRLGRFITRHEVRLPFHPPLPLTDPSPHPAPSYNPLSSHVSLHNTHLSNSASPPAPPSTPCCVPTTSMAGKRRSVSATSSPQVCSRRLSCWCRARDRRTRRSADETSLARTRASEAFGVRCTREPRMCRTSTSGMDGVCLHAAAANSIAGRPDGYLFIVKIGNSGPSYRIQMVELMKYISSTSCLSGINLCRH